MHETKLRRRTLAESLIDELRGQILSGRLAAGEVLPTERELCEAFGVGRTTVREAVQGLMAGGLVRREAGRLVVVDRTRLPDDEIDYSVLASRLSVKEVYETRKLLEVEMARLAAEHHTEEDLAGLRALLERMDPSDTEGYHLLNEEFHEALAVMCTNRVLTQIYLSNRQLFFKLPAYWRVFGNRAASRLPFPGGGQRGHQALYDAIASGDGKRAAKVMFEHLDRVEKRLIERITPSGQAGKGPGGSAVPESEEVR